jgi:hypothetical protein
VPLLIISDRSFNGDALYQIEHLSFPFDSDRLYAKVCEILALEPGARLSAEQERLQAQNPCSVRANT